MKTKFKSILLSSWFLALIIAAPIIFLIPDIFDKYEIRIVDSGLITGEYNLCMYHYDLDNDGYSEQIKSFRNYNNTHGIQIIKNDGGIYNQWNLDGEIPQCYERIAFGDYNNDSVNEVYVFCRIADTITLNCLLPFDTMHPLTFTNKKICILSRSYAEPDYYIDNIRLMDLNGDNNKELVFLIISGYAKFPRNIYAYDINNDTLLRSPEYGAVLDDFTFSDLNQDNKLEIIGMDYAGGNVPNSLGYPYDDYSSWIMAFEHNLKLLFEPIEYPGFRSEVTVRPVTINGEQLLVSFYNHLGSNDNYPELRLLNINGETRKKYTFPKAKKIPRMLFIPDNIESTPIIVFDGNGKISQFDKNLNLKKGINLGMRLAPSRQNFQLDLNNDSKRELAFLTQKNELLITTEEFKHPVLFSPPSEINFKVMSVIQNGDKRPSLFFYNSENYFVLQYFYNPISSIRFLIYGGIFLAVWFFIWLIRKLQYIQIQNKNRIRSQIMELQLKTIKNQMDPHFTYNVFNTIGALIQKESKSAYKPFVQFTRLVRNTLDSSNKIVRSLSEEIVFLTSYLDLEKLRFPDLFDYEIHVSDNVDPNMEVPKMLLQIYVENAIKHGLKPRNEKGFLEIRIEKMEKYFEIQVIDNGIGRARAKEISTGSTGFGLRVMQEYFDLFNAYNKGKIQHEIIDLFDTENNPCGTNVKIFIPLDFSYKLEKHGS